MNTNATIVKIKKSFIIEIRKFHLILLIIHLSHLHLFYQNWNIQLNINGIENVIIKLSILM